MVPFFFTHEQYSIVYMDYTFSIHLSFVHLGCLHSLAIVIRTAMSIDEQVSAE